MRNLTLIFSSLIFISAVFFTSQADAYGKKSSKNPFYIEPYAGYFIGEVEGDGVADSDLSSMYYGARLGVELSNGLIIGVDYGLGKGEVEPNAAGATDLDYEQKDLGAFIGYRLHPRVRVYGSYIVKFEADIENQQDIEGDGYNAGFSIKAAANLKIGLEYQIRNLKEREDGTSLTGDNNKSTTYLLTLKLPVPMPFNIR